MMEMDFYLPKVRSLNISDYDLYKCPFSVSFSNKLNLVFGTNGVGKTTFLNIFQYSVIGPYTGKTETRNYKDEQKRRRPLLDRGFFKNRMQRQSVDAEVRSTFILGKDNYEVWHSLYENKLKRVRVNGDEVRGEVISYEAYEKKYFANDKSIQTYLINKYHEKIVESSHFPDIDSFILMIAEMMFFTEARELAFWDQNMCKSILAKFMPKEKFFEYEEVQKQVKKYDSQARLQSYKMSMIKDFLGDDIDASKKTKAEEIYSLDDLQDVNRKIDACKNRIGKLEKNLADNDREVKQLRITLEGINKQLLEIENAWYDNIFPDAYQESYNRFVPSILAGKCPFCGKTHLRKKVEIDKCFFCGEEIEVKKLVDLNDLEIRRKNLENEKRRVLSNISLLQSEAGEISRSKRQEDKEYSSLIDVLQRIKKHLDVQNNDNVAKYQQLEIKKQEYLTLLDDAKRKEASLALEIDESIVEVFDQYRKIFLKYAYSFLGDDKKIEFILEGKASEAFFTFKLDGSVRSDSFSLSESQRIFVDMAYRLATLEFFHRDAYFISETPDSTLDILFEKNAVKTFSNFIDAGNTLFMSANARNSKLIDSLVRKYKNDCQMINLLEISNLAGRKYEEIRQLNIFDFLGE